MTPEKKYDQLTHGRRVFVRYHNKLVMCRISIDDDYKFLCSNLSRHSGMSTDEKFGYEHSYYLGRKEYDYSELRTLNSIIIKYPMFNRKKLVVKYT